MTSRIRITAAPPSNVAPEHIRDAWVGVEIPLAENQDVGEGKFWSGHDNHGGYMVSTADAIASLRSAGKDEAADFWETVKQMTGHQLRFGTEYCEVVGE